MEIHGTLSEGVDAEAILEEMKSTIQEKLGELDPDGRVQIVNIGEVISPIVNAAEEGTVILEHREASSIQIAMQHLTLEFRDIVKAAKSPDESLTPDEVTHVQEMLTKFGVTVILLEELLRINWWRSAMARQIALMMAGPSDEGGGALLSDILEEALNTAEASTTEEGNEPGTAG